MHGRWQVPAQNNVTASLLGWDKPFGYEDVTAKFWRPGEPDGCCGAEVNCAISNLFGTFQWDDAGCLAPWTAKTGVVCQRYAYQTVF
ncbi:unnamed protein product [Gongylonema pulchrum]|uniref:C-type lectin domain-containing protein n=1 Tax=Gongylonema pulchrum TaxID=637853 RepID=A0A183E9W8_9BILA|nr:unnamed protein product [Gongylonema pulchrum]